MARGRGEGAHDYECHILQPLTSRCARFSLARAAFYKDDTSRLPPYLRGDDQTEGHA